jgi:hypothetical protein
MIESLYLVISRPQGRFKYRGPRIEKVSKRKPTLGRPSEQALVRLRVEIPDSVLEPRVVQVEIKPEHIVQPVVTVKSAGV